MKRLLFFLIVLLTPILILAQNATIRDINLKIKNDDVVINFKIDDKYDLGHHVDFVFIDKTRSVYIPDNAIGSIGNNIQKGENSISFNMINQDFPLDQELTPYLILDHNYKNGPKAALLSVLIPGLGDYYVENPKKMVVKPYMRTLAVGGLLALAVIANNNRPASQYTEKTEMEDLGDWSYNNGGWTWIPDWQPVTREYKLPVKNDFWLFNNDKEIFLGAAISIWVFDIFWVLNKGVQNENIKKAISNRNYNFSLSNNKVSLKINLN